MIDDLEDLLDRLNESRGHCGMCGARAVERNSRDQFICMACLHETIPDFTYRMRWDAADAIGALRARVADLEAALAAARDEALEEAARAIESDNWPPQHEHDQKDFCPHGTYKPKYHCRECEAAAIRALKGR